MTSSPALVSEQQMQALWASIRSSSPHPQQGIFRPDSITWQVNRESALFLGAGGLLSSNSLTPGSPPPSISIPASAMPRWHGSTTPSASSSR